MKIEVTFEKEAKRQFKEECTRRLRKFVEEIKREQRKWKDEEGSLQKYLGCEQDENQPQLPKKHELKRGRKAMNQDLDIQIIES